MIRHRYAAQLRPPAQFICIRPLAWRVEPEAGQYSFEIYFSARSGGEALKGEHPFTVLSPQE